MDTRSALAAGADTHAGSVELLRRRAARLREQRDRIREDIRQTNADLHRATESDRWGGRIGRA